MLPRTAKLHQLCRGVPKLVFIEIENWQIRTSQSEVSAEQRSPHFCDTISRMSRRAPHSQGNLPPISHLFRPDAGYCPARDAISIHFEGRGPTRSAVAPRRPVNLKYYARSGRAGIFEPAKLRRAADRSIFKGLARRARPLPHTLFTPRRDSGIDISPGRDRRPVFPSEEGAFCRLPFRPSCNMHDA